MSTNQLYAGYQSELADFRLAFSRGGAYTAIALVLLGVGLDYGQYPQQQLAFGLARVVVSLLIAGVVVMLYSAAGRRFAPWLTLTWLLLPQIMIAWMISQTEGVESPCRSGCGKTWCSACFRTCCTRRPACCTTAASSR
jgi:two-component system sensor histidine kinase PhcS